MAERKHNIFYKFAKWFKWSSLVVILAPLAMLILNIINLVKQIKQQEFTQYTEAAKIIGIVVLVAAVLWIALCIIMFIGAGKVKDSAKPWKLRIGLIIAFACVFCAEIIDILVGAQVLKTSQRAVQILVICIPLINITGYIIGSKIGNNLKIKLA